MNVELTEIKRTALSLSLAERTDLAEALWDSIESDDEAVKVAMRRAAEIDAGDAVTVPHDEVMRAARAAIQ